MTTLSILSFLKRLDFFARFELMVTFALDGVSRSFFKEEVVLFGLFTAAKNCEKNVLA